MNNSMETLMNTTLAKHKTSWQTTSTSHEHK